MKFTLTRHFSGGACLLVAGALGLIAAAIPQWAYASPIACGPAITGCGCTITIPGIYTVQQNLSALQGVTPHGDCIDIVAPNTILKLKGNSVTGLGTGTGKGIWLESTATSSIVEGGNNIVTQPESPEQESLGQSGGLLEDVFGLPLSVDDLPVVNLWTPSGAQSVVNLWEIGIEVDADYDTVELFKEIGGNLFFPHGNSVAGVLISDASNVSLDNMIVSYNGIAGISTQDANNSRIINVTVDHNGGGGLLIQTSNANTIVNITSDHNGGNGISLYSSTDNQVSTFASSENGLDGIFVGETPVIGGVASTGNHISIGSARQNGVYGVELDADASGNTVNLLTETLAANRGAYDLIDDTGSCTANVWSNNLVDLFRGSPACVGQ
jgi:hypothetical protein